MGYAKRGKRPKKERFVGMPHTVVMSKQFCSLDAYEVKLLLDLSAQYYGRNNGNLTATFTLMAERNWAKGTLYRTLDKLLSKGFVVVTRQGWKQRGKPTLLALTWYGIDEPPDGIEYDAGINVTHAPLAYWCKDPAGWRQDLGAKTKQPTTGCADD